MAISEAYKVVKVDDSGKFISAWVPKNYKSLCKEYIVGKSITSLFPMFFFQSLQDAIRWKTTTLDIPYEEYKILFVYINPISSLERRTIPVIMAWREKEIALFWQRQWGVLKEDGIGYQSMIERSVVSTWAYVREVVA